jgi:hypothetical protein
MGVSGEDFPPGFETQLASGGECAVGVLADGLVGKMRWL